MRKRADILLVSKRLAPNRSRATALLMAGQVFWGERRIDKPGSLLPEDAELTVRQPDRFVSRGGHKLEAALAALDLDVAGLVCADLGASTGGFTDCLLQRGASRVVAIDVGRGLLHETLRQDPRVEMREGTNARHLERAHFDSSVDLVVVDASFISLELLLPAIARILAPGGQLLALVKPQFEAGRREAQRGKGVIRDPTVREGAIARVRGATEAGGFEVLGACDSALAGPKGNVEHFLHARRRR